MNTALRLTIAGVLLTVHALFAHFMGSNLVYALLPLVWAGAAASAVWGLVTLVDALSPVRPLPLPPMVEAARKVTGAMALGPRLLCAAIGCGAILMWHQCKQT